MLFKEVNAILSIEFHKVAFSLIMSFNIPQSIVFFVKGVKEVVL